MGNVKMFIDRVKDLCSQKGVTSGKMLQDCKLNKNVLSSANTRNTLPSTETIMKIAEYFNVSTDWLLTGEGKISKDSLIDEIAKLREGQIVFTVNPYGGGREIIVMTQEDWKVVQPLLKRLKQSSDIERDMSKRNSK